MTSNIYRREYEEDVKITWLRYFSAFGRIAIHAYKLSTKRSEIASRIYQRLSAMAAVAYGKRKYETIDLTGDDDSPPLAPQLRRAQPSSAFSQSQRDSWLEQGNEDYADDIVISSQDGDGTAMATYQLYGMVAAFEADLRSSC